MHTQVLGIQGMMPAIYSHIIGGGSSKANAKQSVRLGEKYEGGPVTFQKFKIMPN